MKLPIKILWIIGTVLPMVMVVGGIVSFIAYLIPNLPLKGTPPSPEVLTHLIEGLASFYVLIASGFLLSFLVQISYFLHLVRSETLNKDQRTLWVIMFLVFRTFAMIIYWFVHVLPGPPPLPSNSAVSGRT
jgi:hypothetical protein